MIQLLGRWGSNAILRYIQEAPLAQQTNIATWATASSSRQSPLPKALLHGGMDSKHHDSPLLAAILDGPIRISTVISTMTPEIHVPVPDINDPRLSSQPLILNTVTLWYHIVAQGLDDTDSSLWKTKCGWRFAGLNFRQVVGNTEGAPCTRCFLPRLTYKLSAEG